MNNSTHFSLHSANPAYDFTNSIDEGSNNSDIYTRKTVPVVPLCEKWLLTIPEAAAYFGVGQNRIAELALQDGCKFVVFVGSKKLIKRKIFEDFLDKQYAI